MQRSVELETGNRVHELAALVTLLRTEHLPKKRIGTWVETLISGVGVLHELRRRQGWIEGLEPYQEELARALGDAQNWIEREERGDFKISTILDPSYPSSLFEIGDKPPILFIKGTWREPEDLWSVSVVGTRKPSSQGLERCRRLVRTLVEEDVAVFSGLATGIDTEAHQSALANGGRTIAVLGSGLDRVYPSQNRGLAERIVDSGGAVVSQFFPHQSPTRWTFPLRNIVLAGLSAATVVVEASETGGSPLQARLALERMRPVFFPHSLVESRQWARRLVEHGLGPSEPSPVFFDPRSPDEHSVTTASAVEEPHQIIGLLSHSQHPYSPDHWPR